MFALAAANASLLSVVNQRVLRLGAPALFRQKAACDLEQG